GQGLGEPERGAPLGRTNRQRQRGEIGGADVLLLLAARTLIVLIHAWCAAPESLDDFDEAVGGRTRRRHLVLEREIEIPGKRVDGFLRADYHPAVLQQHLDGA